MKIKPLGYVVLVKPDEYDETVDFGDGIKFYLNVDPREKMTITTGTLKEIGSCAWSDKGDGSPWAKVGDKVIFSKFAGKTVVDPETKEKFLLMNDEDINAIIEAEE